MSTRERTARAALAEAAVAARHAPSVHNTQPWRWRVEPDALDLFAVRDRQLLAGDPDGRLLTLSCGAALHHAVVALAAEGWTAAVSRLPDPADAEHLARVTLAGRTEVTGAAMRRFQAVRLRHTDRRPVSEVPADPAPVAAAVAEYGIHLHVLTRDQVLDLAAAASRADRVETGDDAQRAELASWTGGDRPGGTGVPDAAIPDRAPETTVPGRDFAHAGTLAIGDGHDEAAVYAVLYGPGDEPADWLRAGEALSAGWLAATEAGIAVLPYSSVVELPAIRTALRNVISGVGYPYLVLRLGTADPDAAGPPPTPRLPASETVEVARG
ncbi:NAD(P)H nitroreductase [Phytohabitans flavus]|uniref:NAD(P)H nitroreductase n=1 Tax=Phytohabitans flavus TaxID=1076124 RepID=A0A6F8XUF2_9ACTN|nr:nitroreductase [Phytohabitans flavus]BCB77440.1 NAD(P)H nitroreductase [Phytohabitans flavus]